MTKMEFILLLHEKLPAVPKEELEERLSFYVEMIDDRMEDGLSEEEAVASVGSVEQIAAQILEEIPLGTVIKGKRRTKEMRKGWQVALLALGAPVWGALLIAAFAVVLSLYVSLWAAFASFAGCGLGGIVSGVYFACTGYPATGIAMVGAGLVCVGLAIFSFYGCKAVTKGVLRLTKKLPGTIGKCFAKREGVR